MSALSSSCRRRSSESTVPVGYWLDGEVKIRRGGRDQSSSVAAMPFSLTLDRRDLQAGGGEDVARPPVAGILDPRPLAVVGEHARAEVDGLVRAVHDHHLPWIDLHHARDAQVVGQGDSERAVGSVRVVEQVRLLDAQVLGERRRQMLNGNRLTSGMPGMKAPRWTMLLLTLAATARPRCRERVPAAVQRTFLDGCPLSPLDTASET